MRTVLGIFAILVGMSSLGIALAAIGDILKGGGDTPLGVLFGLLVFFLGVTGLAGWLAKRMLGHGRAQRAKEREQTILALAARSNGRLTLAEVAAHTELTVDEAKESLERMCRQGVAERHYTDDHAPVFAFRGLMSADDKVTARDPLA